MKFELKLFAAAKEVVGQGLVEVELPDGATVADLRCWLGERHPALAPLLGSTTFAVDAQYATDATPLTDGADVACIPPVSGG